MPGKVRACEDEIRHKVRRVVFSRAIDAIGGGPRWKPWGLVERQKWLDEDHVLSTQAPRHVQRSSSRRFPPKGFGPNEILRETRKANRHPFNFPLPLGPP